MCDCKYYSRKSYREKLNIVVIFIEIITKLLANCVCVCFVNGLVEIQVENDVDASPIFFGCSSFVRKYSQNINKTRVNTLCALVSSALAIEYTQRSWEKNIIIIISNKRYFYRFMFVYE
jgi:hypothetical protein